MTAADIVVHQGRHAPSHIEPNDSLLVVSWNIRHGMELERAVGDLLGREELLGADIILLQEMDETGTVHIAESIGLDYIYVPSGVHPASGRNFGNAVLARWPITVPEVTRLPHKAAFAGHPRVVVGSTVTVGGRAIRACSVHTEIPSLSPSMRLRQFDEIARTGARWADLPLVIGGDFNTITKRSIRALTERMASIGAARATVNAGKTLRRGGQWFTLDHVFARGFTPVASGVVSGTTASDHRPLWTKLEPY